MVSMVNLITQQNKQNHNHNIIKFYINDTIFSLIFNYCYLLFVDFSFTIQRPIDTHEDDAKFLTSIQLLPFHVQKQMQKQQSSSVLYDNDVNCKIITNKYYTISINNDYEFIFRHVITNNLNVPMLIVNKLDTYYEANTIPLCKNANRILNEENAGGSSALSEAFSYEIISKSLKNITLYKTEMQIRYVWNAWKKTDYIVFVKNNNGENVKCAVSVTRAMKYLPNTKYTINDALHLLNKKLHTANESFKGVLLEDEWQTQILHVFCQTIDIAKTICQTFRWLQFTNPTLCSNIVLFITITDQNCHSIYFQKMK